MILPEKNLQTRKLKVAYAWAAPADEGIHIEGEDKISKYFRENFKGLWKGITGEFFQNELEKAGLRSVLEPGVVKLEVLRGKTVVCNLVFDVKEKKLLRKETLKGKKGITYYEYEKYKKSFVVTAITKETNRGGESKRTTVKYTRYRDINGFYLPTLMLLVRSKGDVTLDMKFLSINGKPALVGSQDVKDLKEKIREFEKGYRKWDPLQKVEEMKKLAEEGGPVVAKVIAKCMKDREVMVRLEAARLLGVLGEKDGVPALVSALDSQRKYTDVFKEVCKALGHIGDPRAVKPLAKNILSGKRGDGAFRQQVGIRIDALGNIQHVSAVDELISLFGKCGGGRRGGGGAYAGYRRFISKSLRKLTGQSFRTQNEWRGWWSKNKRSYRFPEGK